MITNVAGKAGEVRITSEGVTLAGSFVDVPDARATALVLSGSGPLDRDSNSPKLRLEVSSAIAGALAARGVSSLRFDKRGTGRSQGDFFTAGFTDNYGDARSALRWLRERSPGLATFVIGHSEGALHAAHLAADECGVSGAVLIACPLRRGEDILTWQARQILPTLPRASRALVRLLHVDPLQSQQKAFSKIRSTTAATVRVQGRKLNARWYREFMDHDPVPVLRRVAVPVLAIIGEHDMQVPPADEARVPDLVRGAAEVEIVKDLSHLLRPDPDRLGPRGYRTAVRQPVSPEVLQPITTWVEARLTASGPAARPVQHLGR